MINLESNKLELRLDRIILKHTPLSEYSESSRISDGFVYYIKGGHKFIFDDEIITTKQGDFLYLPYGSEYKNILLAPDTEYYQFDFVFFENNHPVRLFEKAHVFDENIIKKIIDLIFSVYNTYNEKKRAYKFFCASDVMKIAAILMNEIISITDESSIYDKLNKTLNFLEKYYYLDTSVEELASMSFMGVSNMEKLFKKHIGISPTAYRNKLRIDHAAQMLSDGFTVGEASEKTGFCDAFYFSKSFKKHMGITPREYKAMYSKI